MATRKATETAVQTQLPRRFFELNGKYTISPETNSKDLDHDMGCLLECVDAIVNVTMDGMLDDGGQMQSNPREVAGLMCAADYFLQMIRSMRAEIEVQP